MPSNLQPSTFNPVPYIALLNATLSQDDKNFVNLTTYHFCFNAKIMGKVGNFPGVWRRHPPSGGLSVVETLNWELE